MLPAAARLTGARDFRAVVRRGRRAGMRRLVVHALAGDGGPTRAGFVVSKAVGNAVMRHRVTRQLRHLVRARIERWPSGSAVVVRALPPAANATSAQLGVDLDTALARLGLQERSSGP